MINFLFSSTEKWFLEKQQGYIKVFVVAWELFTYYLIISSFRKLNVAARGCIRLLWQETTTILKSEWVKYAYVI